MFCYKIVPPNDEMQRRLPSLYPKGQLLFVPGTGDEVIAKSLLGKEVVYVVEKKIHKNYDVVQVQIVEKGKQ